MYPRLPLGTVKVGVGNHSREFDSSPARLSATLVTITSKGSSVLEDVIAAVIPVGISTVMLV